MIEYLNSLEGITAKQLEGFFVGWADPLTPKEHLKALQNSEYIVLAVDTNNEKVVGFINALSDKVNFAFIPMLEVLPEYQNQGIGQKLMRKMLALIDHLGCIDLTCDQELQPFYEKFGMFRSQGMVLRKHLNQRGK